MDDLSTVESGMLKSPTTVVLLYISPSMAVNIYLCTEVLLCWVHRYLQLLHLLLGLIPYPLHSALFGSCNSLYLKVYSVCYEYAAPAFFWFTFAKHTFFYPLAFSLRVSLDVKWVSCSHHVYGSCYCLHSASLCLLVGEFNPFAFKVIITMYILIAILLIVLDCFWRPFFFPSSLVLFLFDDLILVLVFLFLFCLCIVYCRFSVFGSLGVLI